MKRANKIGCFHEVKKERNFWRLVWYSRILTCSSMAMNRHTDIQQIVFQKQAWKAMIINDENCSKYISLSIWVKKNCLRANFCAIKQNLDNIVEILWKSPKRVTYSLKNNISYDHICYSMCNINMLIIVNTWIIVHDVLVFYGLRSHRKLIKLF